MKSREQKQRDLDALAEQFQSASAGMLIGFNKLTVAKDQELRRSLRDAGARYSVVKNTLARKAAEGTPFEGATEHFKGVTAMALAEGDPVQLSKAISKFVKDNPDVFTFKAGVVEGRAARRGGPGHAAFEGGHDLEDHVPHQRAGAAPRDGHLGRPPQPRRRRQAGGRDQGRGLGFLIAD